MPLNIQEINDCVTIIERFSLKKIDEITSINSVNISYKLMVVNATK